MATKLLANGRRGRTKGDAMPDGFERHCNGCPYGCDNRHAEGLLPLKMEHNPNTSALLIWQAPGDEEWRRRKPICSENTNSAAARIRKSLGRIGTPRHQFSITNAVQCYPGRGNDGRDKKPKPAAHGQCANWLRMDIEAHDWRRIVVFGKCAELSVRFLGYRLDRRFRFVGHPSGGLSNNDLDGALRWALGHDNAQAPLP